MKMKTHKNLSKCGDTSFNQNGNGALMRIAPLVLLDENDNIIKEYKKDDLIELEKKNLIDSFKLQGLSDKAIERNLKVFLKS